MLTVAKFVPSFLPTEAAIAMYKDMVYSIALTHTRRKSDADDVFQEVFLVYLRKRPQFDDPERRKAWLITTTIYCARQNTSSSWQKKVVLLHEDQERGVQQDQFAFRSDEQDEIYAAILALPEKYKSVVHLFYFEDMSIADISQTLQLEVGTVKVQLSRARGILRDQLKEGYFNE